MGNARHLVRHNALKEAIDRIKLDRKLWVVVKINTLTKVYSVTVETSTSYCYLLAWYSPNDDVENSVSKANSLTLDFIRFIFADCLIRIENR